MKKQKIEKRPTRARRAVKSVVIMLCALLVSNMLGGGHLTRMMALRDGEQRYGVYEKTHELASLPVENIYKTLRVTLMVSENVTYCGASNFYTLLGWQEAFGSALDCADGERVHVGRWSMSRGQGNDALFFWGRIDDAAIARAEVVQQRAVSRQNDGYTFETTNVTPLDLIEDGGYRYFLVRGATSGDPYYNELASDAFFLVCYDSGENEVLRSEIGVTVSSSFS